MTLGTSNADWSHVQHLQWHPETGHSRFSSNHSARWPAWPPCRHVWHQEKNSDNWVTFGALGAGAESCSSWPVKEKWYILKQSYRDELYTYSIPEWEPIMLLQTEHLARCFRHAGQAWTRFWERAALAVRPRLAVWASLRLGIPIRSKKIASEIIQNFFPYFIFRYP